eukprot:3007258-Pyramimonas_sp.AAC.1
MASRYVYKRTRTKTDNCQAEKIIRLRPVPGGFLDQEAFSVETSVGTAKRASLRSLASEAACVGDLILTSLDMDMAFLR